MSILSSILDKLGLHKPAAGAPVAAPAAKPVVGAGPTAKPPIGAGPTARPAAPPASGGTSAAAAMAGVRPPGGPGAMAAPQAAAMSAVDVVGKLEKLAAGSPGLDWKASIVDLMRLLGIDSSLSARKELATELGCPAELMGGDYSKMNAWLHKTVLQKIAENGGNIPAALLKK